MSSSEEPASFAVIEYPLPIAPEHRNYRAFPDELEFDPLTAFHGTSEQNLRSILDDGFRVIGQLASPSFARSSALALDYACKRRSQDTSNGAIVVVRISSLEGIVEEAFGLHVYNAERLPEIVGYCIVPASTGTSDFPNAPRQDIGTGPNSGHSSGAKYPPFPRPFATLLNSHRLMRSLEPSEL